MTQSDEISIFNPVRGGGESFKILKEMSALFWKNIHANVGFTTVPLNDDDMITNEKDTIVFMI